MKFFITFLFLAYPLLLSSQKQLEKLAPSINTDRYDEVGPVLSEDNDLLYFTRVGDPDYVKVISRRKKVEREKL